jgi:C4-dicarboxylate-specific signal transduction histidine kinase
MGSSSSPGESAGLNRRWRLGRRSAWPLVALIIVLLQSLPLSPGNSAQQERVLVNLIGNACDAIVDQPRRPISLSARRDRAVVRLRVQDSGPGIQNEQLQHIFDPFFATTESGLGLGLSVSHTIA